MINELSDILNSGEIPKLAQPPGLNDP